jgi:hypothetical protein
MGELQRSPAGIAKYQEKIDLEPIDFGVLSLVTKFSDSSYSFPVTLTKNGVTEVQSQTPLSDLRLSPGNYKLKVSHPAIKFDQEIFDIEVKSGFRTTKTIILKTSKTRY